MMFIKSGAQSASNATAGVLPHQVVVLETIQVILHEIAQIQNFCDRQPPPGEVEQILDDGGGLFAGLPDHIDGLPQGAFRRQIHEQQLGEAHDAREDIVEVVGYAAGQHSQGLHLLGPVKLGFGLQTLFFQRFELGDVDGDLEEPPAAVNPFDGPVVVDIPALGERVFIFPHVDAGGIAVFIQQATHGAVGAGRGRSAENLPAPGPGEIAAEGVLHALVHEKNLVGLEIGHVNSGIDTVQHREKCFVGILQGPLGGNAFLHLQLQLFVGPLEFGGSFGYPKLQIALAVSQCTAGFSPQGGGV